MNVPTSEGNVRLYQLMARSFPDPSFVFMNHGFLEGPGPAEASLPRDTSVHQHSISLVRHILEGVPLRGRRILDVGCGRGGACAYMARHAKAKAVVGMDLSEENIALNRRTLRARNLTFQQGDAERLPFVDESFDVVTNIESSHCYRNILTFFRQVFRVLKPGGLFCYTDCMHPLGDLTKHYFLRKVGFTVLRETDITEEVARALYSNRKRWKAYVRADDARANPDQRKVRSKIVDTYNRERLEQYSTRALIYKSWLLRKEPYDSPAETLSRQLRKFEREARGN